MRILIDIVHPADVNFYQPAIRRLSAEHEIILTVLKRGKLPALVKKEFPDHEIIVIGKHQKSLFLKMVTLAHRSAFFLKLFTQRKIDKVSSFGFYPGLVSRPLGITSINFHDDKEYTLNFNLTKMSATKFISFCDIGPSKNTIIGHTFKELAYLKEPEFDDSVLEKFGVEKNKFVYVREIANVSLNYMLRKNFSYQQAFDLLREKGYQVIFDAEDPNETYEGVIRMNGLFSLGEMNSIKSNAAFIITSGDTVLREGLLLAVPTIYTSNRKMTINERFEGLYDVALDNDTLISMINKQLDGRGKDLKDDIEQIKSESADITDLMTKELCR